MMNYDEMIAVLQAAKNGAAIQFKDKNDCVWKNCHKTPLWDFPYTEYRVKPQPEEIWVNRYSFGLGEEQFPTKEKAYACRQSSDAVQVRFVEAL